MGKEELRQTLDPHEPPAWVSLWFGLLTGWLVFLFAMFLVLIVSSVVLNHFDITVTFGQPLFVVEVIAASVISIFLANFTGKAGINWLRNQSALVNYVLLVVAILLTLLSFPGIVTFSTVQNMQ